MKLTDEHRQYLEDLRQSGVTNMWGAPDFLKQRFHLTDEQATEIFIAWKHEKEGKS
jgi:hypothetical protein